MNNLYIKITSVLLIFWLLTCTTVLAKESMFGSRDEWLITESYIDDVYKYDFEDNMGSSDAQEELSEYADAIKKVLMFKIMENEENGKFEPEKIVAKNELGAIVVTLRYRDDYVLKEGAKNYGSTEYATVLDGISAMVEALGYENDTKKYSWNGYMIVAENLKLLNKIDISNTSTYLTKGILAQLISNSLDVDIQKEVFDGKYTKYEILKGITLLSENFNIMKLDGFLNAVYGLNLFSTIIPRKNSIQIDEVTYYTNGENYNSLFGKRVEGYAKYDENKGEYYIISLREQKNNVMSASYSPEICSVSRDRIEIKDENGMIAGYPLSDIKYAFYNGDYVTIDRVKTLISTGNIRGNVTFSSTQNDGVYDTVIIKNYSSYAVKFVNQTDRVLILKYDAVYNGKTNINIPTNVACSITDSEGNNIGFEGLKADSAISIYSNIDETYYEIIVSFDSFQGDVIGANEEKYILNDEKEYFLSDSCKEAITNGKLVKLNLGDRGKFYISASGCITDYEIENEVKYAWLKQYGNLRASTVEPNGAIRIFNSLGEWESIEFADTVKIDGTNVDAENATAFLNAKKERIENPVNCANNPIRYSLSSEGKVSFLDTIDNTVEEIGDNNQMTGVVGTFSGEANWSNGFSWKDCPYHMMSSTLIFIIPSDISDEKKYDIKTVNDISQGEKYNIEFYAPDDFLLCAVAAMRGENVGTSESASSFIGSTLLAVEKVVKALDSYGETRYKIVGWSWKNSQSKVELFVDDNLIEKKGMPIKGGVYRYQISSGEISNYDLLVDKGVMPSDFTYNVGTSYERMCGTVVDCKPNYLKIDVDGTKWSWQIPEGSFMLYNKETEKFSKITYKELYTGDKIYIIGAVEYAGAMLIVR